MDNWDGVWFDDDPWCEGCQRGGYKHSPGCPIDDPDRERPVEE